MLLIKLVLSWVTALVSLLAVSALELNIILLIIMKINWVRRTRLSSISTISGTNTEILLCSMNVLPIIVISTVGTLSLLLKITTHHHSLLFSLYFLCSKFTFIIASIFIYNLGVTFKNVFFKKSIFYSTIRE